MDMFPSMPADFKNCLPSNVSLKANIRAGGNINHQHLISTFQDFLLCKTKFMIFRIATCNKRNKSHVYTSVFSSFIPA